MESRPVGKGPLDGARQTTLTGSRFHYGAGVLPLFFKSYSQLACGSRGSPSGLNGKFSSGDTR